MLRSEHRACRGCHCRRRDLFKYRRDEGGFTGCLTNRLPHIPQRAAYETINIFRGIDTGLFANFANMKPGALVEVAKAEADIQALIAERV